MTSTNLSDVQQALVNTQVIQQHWIDGGWKVLSNELEEKVVADNRVLDIYPLVELELDISVTVTIKLPNKIYVVPLEDVSPIHVNDCLTIGVDNLYPDWEQRVETNLGDKIYETTVVIDGVTWVEADYLGDDGKCRLVRLKTDS